MNRGNGSNRHPAPNGFRHTMTWVHSWAGLTLGWVLYLMFVTGTTGYFDTELDRWMKPELPMVKKVSTEHTAQAIVARMQQETPGAKRWLISLPTDRNQPYPNVFWQSASKNGGTGAASGRLYLEAQTAETLTPRDTGGGQTLYQMHWRLHYLPSQYSDWLVGLAGLFMLVGLTTGVIIHKNIFSSFFTLRLGNGPRSWLDAHRFLSVVSLPFNFMMTYSGLLFIGFFLMPFIISSQYPDAGARQFYTEVFDPPGLAEPANISAPLTPLKPIIKTLENRWGKGRIQTLDIRHPDDQNARIVAYESISNTVSASAERLVFDGTSGELLYVQPADASGVKQFRDVLIGLHEGLFATSLLRWLYFLSGLLGSAMVATGLILWTVKRRQKAERNNAPSAKGLRLVEALNAGTVVGLPIAIAAYFAANRLLPVAMAGRANWEVHTLFSTWLLLLLYAAVRPRTKIWQELLALASVAFIALPFINGFTTERNLWQSLNVGDWVFAGVELTFIALSAVMAWAAWKVHTNQYGPCQPQGVSP